MKKLALTSLGAGLALSFMNAIRYLQTTPQDREVGFAAWGILISLPSVFTLGIINIPVIVATILIWRYGFQGRPIWPHGLRLYIPLLVMYIILNWIILEPFRFGSFATPGVIPVSIVAYTLIAFMLAKGIQMTNKSAVS